MARYAAAIDQGTTGTRFMVFDRTGKVVTSMYEEHNWDMDACGVIVGLTRYVTSAHIVRATLEAICYQTRDVVEAEVVRPTVHETTALGAAYAAGLATGLWSNLDELWVNWGVDRVFEPQWDEARREEAYAGWKRAVERGRGWVQEQ